ncbi:MAG: TldD/PmbA family protein [Acidobacteriaceae bacterium]|nr:TldD/PmbA family protein [Acidobacteriaceae bacterium]
MQAEFRRTYELIERTARSLGARNVEVLMSSQADALTRFANNAIHQNVYEQTRMLSIRVMMDHRTARATTNRIDEAAIRRTVEEAIALTRAVEPDPEMLPLHEPEPFVDIDRFDAATANTTPKQRAEAVREAIGIVEAASQTAAGIFSTGESVHALFNSQGVSAFHNETEAQFSITAIADDSSGWAKASTVRVSDFDAAALARSARDKAARSQSPREIEPGRYTVVLEPAAVLDLVGQMFADFSGTAMADQRSFLVDRVGQPLFGENITIYDDVQHPLQAGAAFDGEGVPRRKLTLVEKGAPRELAYSRASAAKAGTTATGHGLPLPNEMGEMPMNIVIAGGDTSLDDIIATTARGVLVTRLWYIREVDPYEKIMTGMTRDGTFWIENGEVAYGLRNFRFNQSLIELLKNVDALSPGVRSSGEEAFDMVVPAMRAREFQFSEVTKF